MNTDTEAGRLHNESIYDQIYTIGIRGGNNEINDTQLKIIATDPSLYEELDDFTSEDLDTYNNASSDKSVNVQCVSYCIS